jgi:hypothetical protein
VLATIEIHFSVLSIGKQISVDILTKGFRLWMASSTALIAMVYAGPEGSDMPVAAVVLGLFAPVLSFYVASNSGFSALSTISYTSQSFGLNTGIAPYIIGPGAKQDPPSGGGGRTPENKR